jgi:hypothetical protein
MAAPADDRVSFTDQLLFLGQRATGQELAMQVVWVYDRAIDLDGVRRFHQNFGFGLFGRRIERSPLPFGRHRWVSSTGPATALDVAVNARPRTALSDWLDERVQLPIDPEWGPGWHLGVLPMTDGSTAVSLVMSHCLSDGLGAFQTIVDAVKGNRRDFGYRAPRSRTRLRAVAADLRDTVKGAPEVAATVGRAARQAFARRHEITRSGDDRPRAGADLAPDRPVVAPAITVYVDLDHWDERAVALNGASHSLVAAFAAKLADRMGRRRAADGAVTLHVPISDRGPDDTRANAASIATVCVDPRHVSSDLAGVRIAIKDALKTLREQPDPMLELLPLTPFIPQWAVKRGSDVVFGFGDRPVSLSNLGDVDPVVARVDGTDADWVMLRGVDRRVTQRYLEQRGGLLTVLAGRIGGKMSITVVAYQPGGENSKPRLRQLVSDIMADFGLTGVID